MTWISETELENIHSKAQYYTRESLQQSTNLEFYLNDLLLLYKTNNTSKISNIIDKLKIMNKIIQENDNKYCEVINRTIVNYKKDAALSTQRFEKIETEVK